MLVFCLTRYFFLQGIFYVRAFHLLQAFQSLIVLIRYYNFTEILLLVLSKLMLETSLITTDKYKTALSKSKSRQMYLFLVWPH